MKVLTEFYPAFAQGVREKGISSLGELLEEMPEVSLLIDATGQERRKPKERGRSEGHSRTIEIVAELVNMERVMVKGI